MHFEESEDFRLFKATAERWIERFGLTDWRIQIVCDYIEDQGRRAETGMSWTQRSARIRWNTNWQDSPASTCLTAPEQTALHEVLHIVLNCLLWTAVKRGDVACSEVDSEEHAVIQRFMRALSTEGEA